MRRLRRVHILVESDIESKWVNKISSKDSNTVSSIMVIVYNAQLMGNLSDKT